MCVWGGGGYWIKVEVNYYLRNPRLYHVSLSRVRTQIQEFRVPVVILTKDKPPYTVVLYYCIKG